MQNSALSLSFRISLLYHTMRVVRLRVATWVAFNLGFSPSVRYEQSDPYVKSSTSYFIAQAYVTQESPQTGGLYLGETRWHLRLDFASYAHVGDSRLITCLIPSPGWASLSLTVFSLLVTWTESEKLT